MAALEQPHAAIPRGSDGGRHKGRFAPTPSGPLHLGSLLTAVASWLDARAHGGDWAIRIDDLDTPRVVPDAESKILTTLERHGLTWDGPVVRQSQHVERYSAALADLAAHCYACRCTRRELRGGSCYPGTCRELGLPPRGNAIRIRVAEAQVLFEDRIQGHYVEDLAATTGDFVIWRRDGFASYQLAVVIDDDAMNISHVVRGADLLDNTPRQLYLLRCLGIGAPSYAHVPLIVEASGVKLSKHNAATAIDDHAAMHNIAAVLGLLGFDAPLGKVNEMLAWAQQRWDIEKMPRWATIPGFTALA